jgi:hypothetical protein
MAVSKSTPSLDFVIMLLHSPQQTTAEADRLLLKTADFEMLLTEVPDRL